MSDIGRERFYEASFSIARNPEEHGFERRPEVAFDLGKEPVVLTSVYVRDSAEDPPFIQGELLGEDISPQSRLIVLASGELATRHLPFVPDDEMKVMCDQMEEASKEIGQIPEEDGFKVIALHAVYNLYDYRPISQTFISNEFVDALSQIVEVPTPTDEELRQLYDTQAEHTPDIEPFDTWVAGIESVLAEAGSQEQANRVLAENYLNFLVVPRRNMHPVVNSLLFERETT